MNEPIPTAGEVRLDKWLWAVRLFHTRTLATEACRAGHVKIGGERVKPARPIRVGEVLTAQVGAVLRTVRVSALLDRRVGAKLVPQYAEDLTPPEEYAKLKAPGLPEGVARPRGAGRPTKRERRELDAFLGLRT